LKKLESLLKRERKMDDCVFCKIARGEIPVEKIYENDNFLCFPDKNPKVKGHALVISKKHFTTTLDTPSTLGHDLLDAIKKTAFRLMKKYKAGGFNIVNNNFPVGGQIIHHVHFHILPRFENDGFRVAG